MNIHPSLTESASQVQILPQLKNSSLVSIGQLCDDNCVAIFDKKLLHIFKNNDLILKGYRNLLDGLWDIPLPARASVNTVEKRTQNLNIIIRKNKPKYELANFYHGAMCSPVIRTLQKAIKNNHLLSWPSINKIHFPTNIIDTQAIHMGHLDQERKNLQSTKEVTPLQANEQMNTSNLKKSFEVINLILPFTAKEMTYGDLTGVFPYASTRGNRYIYI